MMIDIVLPTRNRPRLLQRALESIWAQTVQDYTVYVVNDAGGDVSELVGGYPKAVYLEHDRQKGCGAARNTAIRAGTGSLIAYLDDDDIWLIDHLEILLNGMGESRLCYGDAWYSDERNQIIERKSLDFSYERLLLENLMPVITVMHERSLVDECGLFDENLSSHEDYDLWLRFAKVTSFRHIPAITCVVSVRNDPSRMSLSCDMYSDRETIQRRYVHV
jgi:glycosyltransferase involved in cell wall biosynthesis